MWLCEGPEKHQAAPCWASSGAGMRPRPAVPHVSSGDRLGLPTGKGSEGKYKQCFHQFLTNRDLFVTNDQAYGGCMLSYLVR